MLFLGRSYFVHQEPQHTAHPPQLHQQQHQPQHQPQPQSFEQLFSFNNVKDETSPDISAASEWLPPVTVHATCRPAPAPATASNSYLHHAQTPSPSFKRLRMERPVLSEAANLAHSSGPPLTMPSALARPAVHMPGPSTPHLRLMTE